VWAGLLKLRIGDLLVGVGYDNDVTLAAMRARFAPWLDADGRDRRTVFGVRTVRVGWRRRRVALVHHGVRVRARSASIEEAVTTVATILGDLERRPGLAEVLVSARVLTRGDRAVLYLPGAAATEVDDRPLVAAGIVEAPVWRAVVDTRTGELVTPAGRHELAAIVVTDAMAGHSVDGSRRHLWALADEGDRDGWARLLDEHPELIRRVEPDHTTSTILAVLH